MTNPLVWRLGLAFSLVAATGIAIVSLTFMPFPANAIVVTLTVTLTTAFVYFVQRKEHAARFEAYYAAVQDLGTPIHFGKRSAAFERNGTRFDIEFPKGEHDPSYKIRFFVNGIIERFSIRGRTVIGGHFPDCVVVEQTPLPPEYIVQSRRPEFVLDLLNQRKIYRDVAGYGASFWRGFSITFDEGSFELIWPPALDEQIDGIYKVCQTAVLFYDELKKHAKS